MARRKLQLLSGTGARLRVVAKAPSPAVRELSIALGAELVASPFEPAHLAGAFMAIAATDDRSTNETVSDACKDRGILVSVADDPDASDFHVPAVLRRGDLLVALSTGGTCPGFSHALKRRLDLLLGPEVAVALTVVSAVREQVRARTGAPPSRDSYERLVGDELFAACRHRDRQRLDRLLVDTMGPGFGLSQLRIEPFEAADGVKR